LVGKAKKFPNTKKLKMKPPITITLHFLMYKFSEKRMKKDPGLFNSSTVPTSQQGHSVPEIPA
jgi:hypothetical protein